MPKLLYLAGNSIKLTITSDDWVLGLLPIAICTLSFGNTWCQRCTIAEEVLQNV